MSDKKPWYVVMTPANANEPDSQWVRHGAASHGKVVALPIAWEGWAAIGCFVLLVAGAPFLVWAVISHFGLGLEATITVALVVEAIVIAAFVLLIRSRSTRRSAVSSGAVGSGVVSPDTPGESAGRD